MINNGYPSEGWTALLIAVYLGYADVVEVLLKNGASANLVHMPRDPAAAGKTGRAAFGASPLYIAAERNKVYLYDTT
jgi:ankyrin repeat protein